MRVRKTGFSALMRFDSSAGRIGPRILSLVCQKMFTTHYEVREERLRRCRRPRLSFSRTVVLRYRIHLESRHLAPGTINLRLVAVRGLAYEAADGGLLSPDLAAGIRRVKGVKKIGVRR